MDRLLRMSVNMRILIIMWIRRPVLWIPVNFFPQLRTLSSPNGLMNKVAVVTGMEVMHRFSNMDLYSPRLTCLQLLLSAQSARSTDQHSVTNTAPLPRGSASYLVADQFYWAISTTDGTVFCSYRNRLNTDLPSLHTMLLPKLLSMHLQNALSTQIAFHTALFLVTN